MGSVEEVRRRRRRSGRCEGEGQVRRGGGEDKRMRGGEGGKGRRDETNSCGEGRLMLTVLEGGM
jgi:hypothetical protein